MEIERLRGMVEMLALTVKQKASMSASTGGGNDAYHRELGSISYAKEVNASMQLLLGCLERCKEDSVESEEP